MPFWNLFNSTPPDDDVALMVDNTPTEIANGRLDTIRRNANNDFFQEQEERVQQARAETNKTRAVAGLLAADRLALHRTLAFIEKRWKEGASPEQTFLEAEKVRSQEFDDILADKPQQDRINSGVKAMSSDPKEGRSVLVDGLPVRKKRPPLASSRRYKP